MRNIFLHSKTKLNIDSKQRVNIILSPQLYWVRIFELPLNSTKEVLEVLPSLFEEFVKDDKLSYYTVKIEDKKFLSFAYDETKILNYIKQANLTLNQIAGVYFAQNEFASFVKNNQVCMRVDDVCLSFINDLLVQIPLMIKTDINNDLNIQNITLSKHKIYINSSSKYLDRKSAYILFEPSFFSTSGLDERRFFWFSKTTTSLQSSSLFGFQQVFDSLLLSSPS